MQAKNTIDQVKMLYKLMENFDVITAGDSLSLQYTKEISEKCKVTFLQPFMTKTGLRFVIGYEENSMYFWKEQGPKHFLRLDCSGDSFEETLKSEGFTPFTGDVVYSLALQSLIYNTFNLTVDSLLDLLTTSPEDFEAIKLLQDICTLKVTLEEENLEKTISILSKLFQTKPEAFYDKIAKLFKYFEIEPILNKVKTDSVNLSHDSLASSLDAINKQISILNDHLITCEKYVSSEIFPTYKLLLNNISLLQEQKESLEKMLAWLMIPPLVESLEKVMNTILFFANLMITIPVNSSVENKIRKRILFELGDFIFSNATNFSTHNTNEYSSLLKTAVLCFILADEYKDAEKMKFACYLSLMGENGLSLNGFTLNQICQKKPEIMQQFLMKLLNDEDFVEKLSNARSNRTFSALAEEVSLHCLLETSSSLLAKQNSKKSERAKSLLLSIPVIFDELERFVGLLKEHDFIEDFEINVKLAERYSLYDDIVQMKPYLVRAAALAQDPTCLSNVAVDIKQLFVLIALRFNDNQLLSTAQKISIQLIHEGKIDFILELKNNILSTSYPMLAKIYLNLCLTFKRPDLLKNTLTFIIKEMGILQLDADGLYAFYELRKSLLLLIDTTLLCKAGELGHQKAIIEMQMLAEQAQYSEVNQLLGNFHLEGRFIPKSDELAAYYFSKNPTSIHSLFKLCDLVLNQNVKSSFLPSEQLLKLAENSALDSDSLLLKCLEFLMKFLDYPEYRDYAVHALNNITISRCGQMRNQTYLTVFPFLWSLECMSQISADRLLGRFNQCYYKNTGGKDQLSPHYQAIASFFLQSQNKQLEIKLLVCKELREQIENPFPLLQRYADSLTSEQLDEMVIDLLLSPVSSQVISWLKDQLVIVARLSSSHASEKLKSIPEWDELIKLLEQKEILSQTEPASPAPILTDTPTFFKKGHHTNPTEQKHFIMRKMELFDVLFDRQNLNDDSYLNEMILKLNKVKNNQALDLFIQELRLNDTFFESHTFFDNKFKAL